MVRLTNWARMRQVLHYAWLAMNSRHALRWGSDRNQKNGAEKPRH
jgi:hypothetical protein